MNLHVNKADKAKQSPRSSNAALDQVASDLRNAIGAELIEHLPTERLQASARNARRHSPKQIDQIAASIAQFGFLNPVLINDADAVLAGHGRLAAAKRLGLTTVRCVRVAHLTPEAERAFRIADNRLAELSDWDEDLLRQELEELSGLEPAFGVEITGFDSVDRDRLLGLEGRALTPGAVAVNDGAMPDPVALRRILSRFEHLHGDGEGG